jgi:DNA-binding transcriptional LysR family regulator
MALDWTLLRSFHAVLDHGSLKAAARALSSSQPTIGRHVAELERTLGVPLFERTGNGLLPTQAALAAAEHLRGMNRNAEGLSRALMRSANKLEGLVRISATQIAAVYLLPAIITELRLREPGIQFEIIATNTLSNLLRREADIAVRMVRPKQSSLIAKRIGAVELGAYAADSYLQRRGTPRTPPDLLHHDLIGFDRDDTIRRGFARFGRSLTKDRFGVRSDDHIVTWRSVCAGAGIGFAGAYVGAVEPGVTRVLPSLAIPPLDMWLVTHREIHSSACIRRTYDYLAEALPDEIAHRSGRGARARAIA